MIYAESSSIDTNEKQFHEIYHRSEIGINSNCVIIFNLWIQRNSCVDWRKSITNVVKLFGSKLTRSLSKWTCFDIVASDLFFMISWFFNRWKYNRVLKSLDSSRNSIFSIVFRSWKYDQFLNDISAIVKLCKYVFLWTVVHRVRNCYRFLRQLRDGWMSSVVYFLHFHL